jgi:hypothetical protein
MEAAQQSAPADTKQVTTLPARRTVEREIRVVSDPIPVLDTARFEHMQRVAQVMAACTLVPSSLVEEKSGTLLPLSQITANCFLVVNQAVRWGMDPFAVAQCVSVIKGRLCYEGKLIAAMIEAKLGIRLDYEWSGQGENRHITVKGKYPEETKVRTIEGTVAAWKTTHTGSPWIEKQYDKMLAYRGAREWARLHAPGLMLGIYSDEEMADLSEDMRASRAKTVTTTTIEAPDPDAAPPVRQLPPAQQEQPAAQSTAMPDIPDPDADGPGLGQSEHSKDVQAEKQALYDTLIAEVQKIESPSDLFEWQKNYVEKNRGETLTAAQRRGIDKVLSSRLSELNRD